MKEYFGVTLVALSGVNMPWAIRGIQDNNRLEYTVCSIAVVVFMSFGMWLLGLLEDGR